MTQVFAQPIVTEPPTPATLAADLITFALEAYPWSETVEPERRWLPFMDLEELYDRLRVQVVPAGVTYRQLSRQKSEAEAIVDIGLMRKPDPTLRPDVDSLKEPADAHTALANAIALHLRADDVRQLGPPGGPVVSDAQVTTLLLLEHLEGLHQLTSVVRVTVLMTCQ